LALAGWEFTVRPADVDESLLPGERPEAYVLRLAKAKAQACAGSVKSDQVILAADTTVADGNIILGKPRDAEDARNMLLRLRGHTHQVLTGLALLRAADGNLITDLCVTSVPMRLYRDEEMDAYIASGDPLDKAGAYAIQHALFHPVIEFSGCYASVMGLALCHLTRSLQKLGYPPQNDIPRACQSGLAYTCPIFPAVLSGEMAG